jgi:hypothetical protein
MTAAVSTMTERILPAVAVRAALPTVGPGFPTHRGPASAGAPRPVRGDGTAGRGVPAGTARPGAAGGTADATTASLVRPHAQRSQALLSTPARAGMLLGVSAAVYAVSLAGVSALQASSDAQLAAQRQPALDAVAAARSTNDALEAALARAGADAQAAASAYDAAGNDIAAYQARVDELAALVADVQGSAASLPSRISLPKVTVRAPTVVTRSSAPRTTTRTTASGH